jgi:hypothetical protein
MDCVPAISDGHSTWPESGGGVRLVGRSQLDFGLRRKVLAHGGRNATQAGLIIGGFALDGCRGWLTPVPSVRRQQSDCSIAS